MSALAGFVTFESVNGTAKGNFNRLPSIRVCHMAHARTFAYTRRLYKKYERVKSDQVKSDQKE